MKEENFYSRLLVTTDLPTYDHTNLTDSKKRPGGGSDVGYIEDIDGQPTIVKGGVGSLLIAQAIVENAHKNNLDGNIDTTCENLARDLGLDTRDKKIIELQENLKKVWNNKEFQTKITGVLNKVREKDAQWDSMDKAITPQDVSFVQEKLYEAAKSLDIDISALSVTTNFGIINQASSQHLVNKFLESQDKEAAPAQIIASNKSLYLGSQLLPKENGIEPLDKKVISFFDGVKEGKKTKEQAKEDLKSYLTKIDGLFSATFLRLVLGEGADNNLDNSLVTASGQVIPIDITGNRGDRKDNKTLNDRKTKEPFTEYGYSAVIGALSDRDELLNILLDKTVFKDRYAQKDDELHKHVVEAIKEVAGDKAVSEVSSAVEWLASLDDEKISKDFQELVSGVNERLSDSRKMPDDLAKTATERVVEKFIKAPIAACKEYLKVRTTVAEVGIEKEKEKEKTEHKVAL